MGSSAKCSTIRHVVRLRQILRRWRARACERGNGRGGARLVPSDVPEGHLAVCVGSRSRRFVVKTSYLNHPLFRKLLIEAEEVFGYDRPGPLAIPCDESHFEEILRYVSSPSSSSSCKMHGTVDGCWNDSIPLLRGFERKSSSVR